MALSEVTAAGLGAPIVGATFRTTTVVTANYTVQPNDQALEVVSAVPITITFPAASLNNGRYLTLKRTDSGFVDLMFVDAGGGTIEGLSTFKTAAGKTTHGFRASAAANDWRFEQTYIPGILHTKYASITNKAGDTVNNPTTESQFASQATFAANYLGVGQNFRLDFAGLYTIPTGTVAPTAQPRIKIGAVTLATTAPLTVGVGTGVQYGFTGYVEGVVESTGPTGVINCGGLVIFQTALGATPSAAQVVITTGRVTVDTTVDSIFGATVITTPSAAGTQFIMTRFSLSTSKRGADSN